MKCSDAGTAGSRFRMVFADIDGTLVDGSGVLSARTLRAVNALRMADCRLVLCTGRGRQPAQNVADQIDCSGYGIVLNGAVVLEWESGKILRRSLLPAQTVESACAIARTENLAAVWLGAEDRTDALYVENGTPLWPHYEARNRSRLKYVETLASVPEAPASLAAYGSEEQAVRLAREWQRSLGPDVTAVAGPTAVYHAWYAQLTTSEADKGIAAAFLAGHFGIPREQTLAIGDHVNDIGLLRWSGMGISMADGHPDARSASDYITGSFAEDGAASALERFVLGN